MNTTKKIVVALAVMMIAAAMAAPAAMGDTATYSATVQGMQNTYISDTPDVGFDNVVAGSDFADNAIAHSLTLTNDGNQLANVSAKFNDSVGGTFGLVNASGGYVIGGSNFTLGNSTLVALANTNTDTWLGTDNQVSAGGSINYGAQLRVPTNQPNAVYEGDVVLMFANA